MNGISKYRNLIVGTEINVPVEGGRRAVAINFDNAATTPPLKSVMEAVEKYAPWYSSIHRGAGFKSKVSSMIYDDSREKIASFVGADVDKDLVIYVRNTTEAINMLSYCLEKTGEDTVILSSLMEHHSNNLPWRDRYVVDYIETDACGKIIIESMEKKLKEYGGRVKLVAVTGASNVTGYINPIHQMAKIAHSYGAKILVDGAQLVPHSKVDMKPHESETHIDFLVFSAHKMYAPFGAGILIAPRSCFSEGKPHYSGGGTVKVVTVDKVLWEDMPNKEEAGTPNIMGVVALVAAINTLEKIGMENIYNYEDELKRYALEGLKTIRGVRLYCVPDRNTHSANSPSVSIIPMNIEGLQHDKVAEILSSAWGIAVRNGCFCAQPYIQKLLKISSEDMKKYFEDPSLPRPGMVRLSFGMYNDKNEIDRFLYAVEDMIKKVGDGSAVF